MSFFVQTPGPEINPLSEVLGTSLGQGLGAGLGQLFQEQQAKKQAEQQQAAQTALSQAFQKYLSGEATDEDIALLSPELMLKAQEKALKEEELGIKREEMGIKGAEKTLQRQEKIVPIQTALQSLSRMKELRQEGLLGRGSAVRGLAGGKTAKARGEYQQLGKSLITYATSIPIRNRVEFETLAEKIYDPNITDAEAEGVLNAMEQILMGSLQEVAGEDLSKVLPPQYRSTKPSGEKPPLESFFKK